MTASTSPFLLSNRPSTRSYHGPSARIRERNAPADRTELFLHYAQVLSVYGYPFKIQDRRPAAVRLPFQTPRRSLYYALSYAAVVPDILIDLRPSCSTLSRRSSLVNLTLPEILAGSEPNCTGLLTGCYFTHLVAAELINKPMWSQYFQRKLHHQSSRAWRPTGAFSCCLDE